MGIGRREFLKIMGVALAGLAVDPLQAIAINEDYYINKKLGIALVKPKGWHFLSIRSFQEMKVDQILPIDDDELEKEIKDAMDPVLAMTKYPDIKEYENRFSPAISVYCELYEFREGDTIVDLSYRAGEWFKNVLTDYTLTSLPKSISVSNCDAVEMNASFIFTHMKLEPIPLEAKTVMVYQGPILYTIHMFDSKYLSDTTQREFGDFIANFKLV